MVFGDGNGVLRCPYISGSSVKRGSLYTCIPCMDSHQPTTIDYTTYHAVEPEHYWRDLSDCPYSESITYVRMYVHVHVCTALMGMGGLSDYVQG